MAAIAFDLLHDLRDEVIIGLSGIGERKDHALVSARCSG
jgi:thiamine pyrophosphokinase